MSGSKIGGQKAAATNKAKYGPDFYRRIGSKGGSKGTTGGFAANRELARIAGAKGGRISRRVRSTAPRCINGHVQEPYNLDADFNCIKCAKLAADRLERERANAMHFSKYDGEVEAA